MGLLQNIRSLFPIGKTIVVNVRDMGFTIPYGTFSSGNQTIETIKNYQANTFATLGFDLYQKTKKGRYKAYNHDAYYLTRKPNDEETWPEFIAGVSRDIDCGAAYIRIKRIGDRPISLLRVSATVNRDDNGKRYFTVGKETVPDKDMIYIPNTNTGGEDPKNIVQTTIQIDNAIDSYLLHYFNNNPGSRLFIEPSDQLKTSSDLKKLYDGILDWYNKHLVGAENAGKPGVVPPGTKIQQIDRSSNQEAQLQLVREYCQKLICNAYTFPYTLLSGDYGNNLSSQQIIYLQRTILPRAVLIAHSFTRKLLSEGDQQYMYFEFDFGNILMADIAASHQTLRSDFGAGLIELDEVRHKMNLPSYDGEPQTIGEAIFVPSSLIPASNKWLEATFKKWLSEQEHFPGGDQQV